LTKNIFRLFKSAVEESHYETLANWEWALMCLVRQKLVCRPFKSEA